MQMNNRNRRILSALLAALTAVMMTVSCAGAETAADDAGQTFVRDGFSLDTIRESRYAAEGRILLEDDREDTGNIYVYNNIQAENLFFTHSMESENFYSYLDFDIVIVNPETESERPILRMWINLWTAGHSLNVSSVSFFTGGREYVFRDLSDPEDFLTEENDFKQTMLIRFDMNSIQFLSDLEMSHLQGETSLKAVFHGTEEIETTLDERFWPIFDMYRDLYLTSGAQTRLDGYNANPMVIRLAEIQE